MFSKEVYFMLVLLLNVRRNCGRNLSPLQSRIVNGMDAPEYKFDYYVQLSSYTPSSDGYYVAACGCTLITLKHGLTAAHCFEGNPDVIEAWAGYSSDTDWKDVQKVFVQFYYVHPEFDIYTLRNDLAVTEFYEPVTATKSVGTAILNCDGADTPPGTPVVVAGHGVTSYDAQNLPPNLKYTNLNTTSPEECLEIDPFFDSNQICATSVDGSATCFGDSGAGLMQVAKNSSGDDVYVQCGIVSYGPGDCKPKDGFTKTSSYTEWIKGVVALGNNATHKYEVTCTEIS